MWQNPLLSWSATRLQTRLQMVSHGATHLRGITNGATRIQDCKQCHSHSGLQTVPLESRIANSAAHIQDYKWCMNCDVNSSLMFVSWVSCSWHGLVSSTAVLVPLHYSGTSTTAVLLLATATTVLPLYYYTTAVLVPLHYSGTSTIVVLPLYCPCTILVLLRLY